MSPSRYKGNQHCAYKPPQKTSHRRRAPPLTKLERLVLDQGADFFNELGFEGTCERVRVWLRAEVDRRLREVAKAERVEVACRTCGKLTDVSRSHAEKLSRVPAPQRAACKWPERAAREDAEPRSSWNNSESRPESSPAHWLL